MTLWFVFSMMTAAAIFAVLWPLGQRRAVAAVGHDLRIYRDQLDEIDRDRAAGRIGAAEAEAAKIEVSRRLLTAADRQRSGIKPASPRDRRVVALAALIALPLLSTALYLLLGSPFVPGQPLAARIEAQQSPPLADLVAQVEQHLAKDPQDAHGWEVIAPVYMQLGRFDDAARAWRNAVTYGGSTARREANLGEALTAAANGVVTADAKAAFDRAARLDPNDVKSHYFLGLAAEQDGDKEEARRIWQALLNAAAPGAPWADFVRASLARLNAQQAPSPLADHSPGPSSEDVAAAANMNPQQREQMVRGMVERLAARLKTDRSDFDGWLRLVRAYMVLGERDKARAAIADARQAIGNDAEKNRQLDALIKSLGLEG